MTKDTRVMVKHICPHCKNPIHDNKALLCLYCGGPLRRESGVLGRIKYTRHKIILAASIILLILAFGLLMLR